MRVDKADSAVFYIRSLAPHLINGMKREHRFHQKRRWRFDLVWIEEKLAVEIDGGQWKPGGGRHNTDADREKMNAAALLGWRVLRFSASKMESDPIAFVDEILIALGEKK